jgi:hypoxanthine-DNA glycosylase
VTETNPFGYFVPANTKLLIVGSFPCYNGLDYGEWFYSGSGKNMLWNLLSDVFALPANTKAERKHLCETQGIALTDVAKKIRRKKANCQDSNLQIEKYNIEGLKKCLAAQPQCICFTGRFAESHFRKLFPEVEIPTVLLLSPSPAANIHIGGLAEYKRLISEGKVTDPYGYRLLKYREQLSKPSATKVLKPARPKNKNKNTLAGRSGGH